MTPVHAPAADANRPGHPPRSFLAWGQRLAGVGLAQGLVQGLGLASGILVIRFLSPDSYALYSLAYSVLGMMSVLADAGISSGGMAEAGKVWQDREKLGQVLTTILRLRRRFAWWAIGLFTPALVYLLHAHGASWVLALVLSGLVTLQFLMGLQIAVYNVAPALHQWIGKTQRIALGQQVVRAACLAAGAWLSPTAFMAMLAALPAQWWNLWQIKKLSNSLTHPARTIDREVQSRVLAVVRRIMPGAIYFAFSGQITIWLISMFGNTATLAQIGALGRLAQAFTVVSSVFSVVFIPRFSRLHAGRGLLLARYFQVLALALGIGLVMCAAAAFYPRQVLWVLGKNYAGLEHELLLQSIAGLTTLLFGLAFQLSAVRSVVINQLISIPVLVLIQVALIPLFDFSTSAGVLYFAILGAILQFLAHAGYFLYATFFPGKGGPAAPGSPC